MCAFLMFTERLTVKITPNDTSFLFAWHLRIPFAKKQMKHATGKLMRIRENSMSNLIRNYMNITVCCCICLKPFNNIQCIFRIVWDKKNENKKKEKLLFVMNKSKLYRIFVEYKQLVLFFGHVIQCHFGYSRLFHMLCHSIFIFNRETHTHTHIQTHQW